MPNNNSSRYIHEPLPMCDDCMINGLKDDLVKVNAQDVVADFQRSREDEHHLNERLENDEFWSEQAISAVRDCIHQHKDGACIVNLS